MDTPQDQSGNDADNADGDNLSALDFSVDEDDSAHEEAVEALKKEASRQPETEDERGEEADIEAIQAVTEVEEEEELPALFTVSNPSKSVSVSALMDGRIHQVSLSKKVERMTESDLTEEITVIAELARQKGRSAQFAFIQEGMTETGAEGENVAFISQIVKLGMDLPTPEEAELAEAEVFETRYGEVK